MCLIKKIGRVKNIENERREIIRDVKRIKDFKWGYWLKFY